MNQAGAGLNSAYAGAYGGIPPVSILTFGLEGLPSISCGFSVYTGRYLKCILEKVPLWFSGAM